ncbi:MAG: hypothetical protein M5U13_02945 [Thermoanaerobaculia bacterium]|nr:hypothetical protein [Thermoanaerobaculia bacterium]
MGDLELAHGPAAAGGPGSRAGWRELLAAPPERWLSGRNVTKAEVGLFRAGETRLAVKTFARRPVWVRLLLGRWVIRREAAAYVAAAGIDGLPRFFGRPQPCALATEWVDAVPLPERGRVGEEVFRRVAETVAALHVRGIALGDLHHRNVLVGDDGRVVLVDLATAWLLGVRPSRLRRAVFRRLCALDELALARMRARWTGGDVDAAVAAVGGSIARWHRRGRKLKTIWRRLRGKGRR